MSRVSTIKLSPVRKQRSRVKTLCIAAERNRWQRRPRGMDLWIKKRNELLSSKYFDAVLVALAGTTDADDHAVALIQILTIEFFRGENIRKISPKRYADAIKTIEKDKLDMLRALSTVKRLAIKNEPVVPRLSPELIEDQERHLLWINRSRQHRIWAEHSFEGQVTALIRRTQSEHPMRWLDSAYQIELWGGDYAVFESKGGGSSRVSALIRAVNAHLPKSWPNGISKRDTAIRGLLKIVGYNLTASRISSALRP